MSTGAELYLTLRLQGGLVGLPVSRVREIFEPDALTRVPGAGASIRGVVNLRGAVVPIVDLSVALGLEEAAPFAAPCVVLVQAEVDGERVTVGLASDGALDLVEIAPEDVKPAPAFGTTVAAPRLVGLARARDVFVQLLDVEGTLRGLNEKQHPPHGGMESCRDRSSPASS